MKLTTLRAALVASAGLAASACSTADLEMFNAGLEMYNGVQYYDQNAPNETLECGSGDGYLIAHSGVRNNQKYVYFTSRARRAATVSLIISSEQAQTWNLSPGEESDIYWTYPSYTLEASWNC